MYQSANCRRTLYKRPGHVFVHRPGTAAAAKDQKLGRRTEASEAGQSGRPGDGRRRDSEDLFPLAFSPSPLSPEPKSSKASTCVSRSNPNRIGLPVTRTGQRQRRSAAVSAKAVQISVARRASQRVALAGYGVLFEQHQRHVAPAGGAGHRHADVSAQSHDRGDMLLAQESPGGQIAGQILDNERNGLAGAPGATGRDGSAKYSKPASATACRSKGFPPPQNVIRTRGIMAASCSATARPGNRCPPVPPPLKTI